MLSEVFYVSRSIHRRGHVSDVEIVRKFSRHKAELGLTGLMIRGADWFAHSLEGPKAAIEQVLAGIRSDARHEDVSLWRSDGLNQRRFPEWRVVFADSDEYQIEIELLFRTSNLPIDVKQSHMLRLFENHLDQFNLRWRA